MTAAIVPAPQFVGPSTRPLSSASPTSPNSLHVRLTVCRKGGCFACAARAFDILFYDFSEAYKVLGHLP